MEVAALSRYCNQIDDLLNGRPAKDEHGQPMMPDEGTILGCWSGMLATMINVQPAIKNLLSWDLTVNGQKWNIAVTREAGGITQAMTIAEQARKIEELEQRLARAEGRVPPAVEDQSVTGAASAGVTFGSTGLADHDAAADGDHDGSGAD